jgi:hypothetical protein
MANGRRTLRIVGTGSQPALTPAGAPRSTRAIDTPLRCSHSPAREAEMLWARPDASCTLGVPRAGSGRRHG